MQETDLHCINTYGIFPVASPLNVNDLQEPFRTLSLNRYIRHGAFNPFERNLACSLIKFENMYRTFRGGNSK